MELQDQARQVAEAIRGSTGKRSPRWFIHCDTDADGITAAAVMAVALRRIGHRYQVRGSREKATDVYEAMFQSDADGYILVDKGTSHLKTLSEGSARTGRPVVVVDHHNIVDGPLPEGVVVCNPRLAGLDGGRDASSSTTAAAVALQMGQRNLDQAATALCGAIGDWQHMGGWQGWNKTLIDQALEDGHLERRNQPAFIGVTLAHALAHRRPAVPGLDDVDGARAFLDDIKVDPDAEVEDLDKDAQTRLLSAVTLRCAQAGWNQDAVRALVTDTLVHPALETSLRHVFRLVDACGRQQRISTGIAMLLGDPAARQEAESVFSEYKRILAESLDGLQREGTRRLQALQHHQISDPSYTGMVGGIGITHILEDTSVPACITAPRSDGRLQVSTRGTNEQVAAGMDLGQAVSQAAQAVGAEGGGHPVAAGTVIDPDDLERFLSALDEALKDQGWLEPP